MESSTQDWLLWNTSFLSPKEIGKHGRKWKCRPEDIEANSWGTVKNR